MSLKGALGIRLPFRICATATGLLSCREVIIIGVSTGSGSPSDHLNPNFYDL